MTADTHWAPQEAGVPDGTRPLHVPSVESHRVVAVQLDVDAEPLTCFTAMWSERHGPEAGYAHCRRIIQPLEHYLLWTGRDLSGRPAKPQPYCAPCAVKEWASFGVREAT